MKDVSLTKNFTIVKYLLILYFFLIVLQLFRWQVLEKEKWETEYMLRHQLMVQEKPERGKIYSADGFVLASNEKVYGIYVIPKEIKDIPAFVDAASKALSIPQEDILKSINSGARYVALKHKADKTEVLSMLRVDCEINGKNCGLIELENPNYFAVRIEEEWKRVYPENELACHVLGFVGGNGIGQYGVEEYYNGELEGEYGYVIGVRDQHGRLILSDDLKAASVKNGMDIYLTIDRGLQKIVERIVKEHVDKHGAVDGTVIVMRPKTGEILAMANYPVFNPNFYWRGEIVDCQLNRYKDSPQCKSSALPNTLENKDSDNRYAIYQQDLSLVFKNVAVSELYEPGSVIKVLTVAAGIDSGAITPESKVEDHPGCINVIGHSVCTWNKVGATNQTIKLVLINSDNIGAYYIARKVGKEKFYDYLDKFGVGHLTKAGLAGENVFPLKQKENWNEADLATSSFGQGVVSVTPLQLISALNIVANGGLQIQPHIVSKFVSSDKGEIIVSPFVTGQPISPESAYQTAELLRVSIEQSHIKKRMADILQHYTVAGKTGTAQVPKSDGGGYYEDKVIATFVGWIPAHDPQLIILARLKDPSDTLAAGNAVPMWAEVAREAIAYLNIPPDRINQ
uniref:Penicillin-binding protein 2 n=1 Tax=candidate division CPR3 bacterium TaxID=2268181 RepID=A0A7C5URH0_UNCC3